MLRWWNNTIVSLFSIQTIEWRSWVFGLQTNLAFFCSLIQTILYRSSSSLSNTFTHSSLKVNSGDFSASFSWNCLRLSFKTIANSLRSENKERKKCIQSWKKMKTMRTRGEKKCVINLCKTFSTSNQNKNWWKLHGNNRTGQATALKFSLMTQIDLLFNISWKWFQMFLPRHLTIDLETKHRIKWMRVGVKSFWNYFDIEKTFLFNIFEK